MDYSRNLKYFDEFSLKLPGILIAIGVIAFLIGTGGSAGALIFGILMIAAGVAYIVLKKKGTPTDEEYDNICSSQCNNMTQKALNKLGVDEDEVKEIAPIVFDGYCYSGFDKFKQGKDNKWRTNKYQAVQLFFSANEVHVYTYTFTTTEDKKTESTDVYFYKDIVSVSTATETAKLKETVKGKTEDKDVEFECFKLTTAGGTAFEVSVRDSDSAQRSINAMRQLLRAKKQA